MDPWITVEELAMWVQQPIPPADPFASLVIMAATIKVNDATGYARTTKAFTASTAPDGLKVIVGQVAKRAYKNPDQIVREGSIGPLGGDTYAAAYAAGLTLTEEEKAEIARISREAVGGAGAGNRIRMLTFGVYHNPVDTNGDGHVTDSSGTDWTIPLGLP